MDRAQITRLLLIACILYVIGFYFIGSAIKPGYSQLANFVSEYNATGTAWARTLTFAGFFATAILFSAFLLAARPLAQVSGISRLGFLALAGLLGFGAKMLAAWLFGAFLASLAYRKLWLNLSVRHREGSWKD